MTQAENSSNGKGPKWMRPLLFVSLALNLLVVGAVSGMVLRHDPKARYENTHTSPMRNLGYGPYDRALSPKDRGEINREIAKRDGDLRANRNEVRLQFTTLLVLLRATPFDADAVRNIVEGQRTKLNERQLIGQNVLLNRITAMSDGERATFAGHLERSLRRSLRRN
ncbi:MAG: periplasmic heavy metal sensor [Paracoccaceae bacterium]